jgi:hypothetical protein
MMEGRGILMSKRFCITLLITASVLLFVACGGDELDDWEPSHEVIVHTLSIVDSIGQFDMEGDYEFCAVTDIDRGQVGEILVLDGISNCIHVYSADGEYVSQLGNSGYYRTRLSSPEFFEVLGNGNICVTDGDLWKRYHRDGEFNESLPLIAMTPMQMASLDEYEIVGIQKAYSIRDDQLYVTKRIARWSEWAPAAITVTFLETGRPIDRNFNKRDILTIDLFPMMFAVGDNYTYIAPDPRNAARVQIYSHAGQLTSWIDLPYERVVRPKEELQVEKLFIEEYFFDASRGSLDVKWRPSTYRPMIRSLGVDSFNNLWVQRGTELTPTFDVYDLSENHIFTAVLPEREDAVHWRFDISDHGILAVPADQGHYPVVYIIERVL